MTIRSFTNKPKPRRRSIRLKGYDYGQAGAYFVTICTQDRLCLFGEVIDDRMHPNDAGEMTVSLWEELPTRFPDIQTGSFVVMPNHLHGIVVLPDNMAVTMDAPAAFADKRAVSALVGARSPTLGRVIGAFKSAATVAYISGVKARGWTEFSGRLWQRNYYEHVIRDDAGLNRVCQYIDENPTRWDFDDENPNRLV